ncbi:hypothetical protein B0H14DRAFT_3149635 [Mycena olivaceomarginata]|nr:hypothetical protein B0H14DRAFT_3149635 [Mycena olivaceomarginata]
MHAAVIDTGQTAAHLGLAQQSIAPSTLPNSPTIAPMYRQLEGSSSQSSFVRLARPGLLCKFEDMNRKNLDKPDCSEDGSIPAQRVLPYVVSMILLQFIDIMIFPSTWTDQCQMCGVPRHPSAAWPSSFLTSTRSLFGVFVPLLLDLRAAPFSVCYIQS